MKFALASIFALIFASASTAQAQTFDPAIGARLARTVCNSCHVIGNDPKAKKPDPAAPSFLDISRMSSTTELSLKVFLRSSHKNMPNIMLTPEEIDSLAAYILGLARK